jgi:glucose-6-phosphate isomerase
MSTSVTQHHTCLEHLLELKAASRLGARDATLFTAHPDDAKRAQRLLGWTDLCSKPPSCQSEISKQAAAIRAEGLEAVVLIGQGGSSQAAMTITKLYEMSGGNHLAFRTMDSLSPVFVNHILGSSDPARTVYIVSSKSGSTIEPLMLERVAWRYVSAHLGTKAAARRFVAITDPDSDLERIARNKGYRLTLSAPVDVGGRFSALSAFALFPAALIGIDVREVVALAAETERRCAQDDPDNPALRLACFLYDGYREGRDKFSLILPPTGQVFGLWVEQLVAESLGKEGRGVLPNVEVDASILLVPRADRTVITYAIGSCEGFRESIANIDESIPRLCLAIDSPSEVFSCFVIWEYAIAFLGILLEIFPFDQPDVEITKVLVKRLLANRDAGEREEAVCEGKDFDKLNGGETSYDTESPGLGNPLVAGWGETQGALDYREASFDDGIVKNLRVSAAVSDAVGGIACADDIDQTLRALFGSLKKGDYFSLNAFLPFRGYGRREALERMRNRVASRLGVVSCLEIGPRYLHSTGQLHKGGPNNGVFLILSADEDNDIIIPDEEFTLGELAAIQAQGDFTALASRGRRVVQIHLSGNDSETLSRFADRLCSAISAVKRAQ